jgi:hypothetical protein
MRTEDRLMFALQSFLHEQALVFTQNTCPVTFFENGRRALRRVFLCFVYDHSELWHLYEDAVFFVTRDGDTERLALLCAGMRE